MNPKTVVILIPNTLAIHLALHAQWNHKKCIWASLPEIIWTSFKCAFLFLSRDALICATKHLTINGFFFLHGHAITGMKKIRKIIYLMIDFLFTIGPKDIVSLKNASPIKSSTNYRKVKHVKNQIQIATFIIMTFRLCNTPAIVFLHLMHRVLASVPNCEAYLDDVVYLSKFVEHLYMSSLHVC